MGPMFTVLAATDPLTAEPLSGCALPSATAGMGTGARRVTHWVPRDHYGFRFKLSPDQNSGAKAHVPSASQPL
jgi:hypothetical protein